MKTGMDGIELVIFDCDGVLVDSEIVGIRIECELLRGAGHEIAPEVLAERFSGMAWADILLQLELESRLPLSRLLLDKAEALLDERIPVEAQLIPGVMAALASLPYRSCVCSNTRLARVNAVLSKVGLLPYFGSNIFSANDLGRGREKPKPDIFLFGAERMGVISHRTVVVEDSVHGVQAGCSAGMRVIGFTGGAHSYPAHAQRLLDAGASTVIHHMNLLTAAMTGIAARAG